ncbi:POK19 protein, partial [Cephalopterus ornatus]|nr:POK19 protein [Cephalopterus ornatus]
HFMIVFTYMGIPQEIKTDNGPGYTASATREFLALWGIRHKTGIPHNPTGQAIVERAHLT